MRYKLEHGISRQHVALDILRNQGFDLNLVKEAQSIVAQAHIDSQQQSQPLF